MGIFAHLRNSIYQSQRPMINIASLYYFTLLQRLSPKYKGQVNDTVRKIRAYIREEWLKFSQHKKTLWNYEVLTLKIQDIWELYFFQKWSYSHKLYYLPSFFMEIYVDVQYIKTSGAKKKMIFLLSNIFECFDEFEEKNILIEIHNELKLTRNDSKKYFLRHDFQNIDTLWKTHTKTKIKNRLQKFAKKCKKHYTPSEIKNESPETYRSLLFLLYNVFAIHKSLEETQGELKRVQNFQKTNSENAHISLSQERLKLNKTSLEKILPLYKTSFEHFMHIISGRKM